VSATSDMFRAWARENLPRGYEWPEITLFWISGFAATLTVEDRKKLLRADHVGLRAILEGLGLFSEPEPEWLPQFVKDRAVAEGSLDLRGLYQAHEAKNAYDPSTFVHPERARFGLFKMHWVGGPGAPPNDRLKFKLLLTPYAKVIEGELDKAQTNNPAKTTLKRLIAATGPGHPAIRSAGDAQCLSLRQAALAIDVHH